MIDGGIFLCLTGTNPTTGERYHTGLMANVSGDTEHFYLSCQLEQLAIISKNFPEVGATANITGISDAAIHMPVLVPIHWKEQVKEQLDKDVAQCILEQVEPGTLTTWCHRMVVTAKPTGLLHHTVDL